MGARLRGRTGEMSRRGGRGVRSKARGEGPGFRVFRGRGRGIKGYQRGEEYAAQVWGEY